MNLSWRQRLGGGFSIGSSINLNKLFSGLFGSSVNPVSAAAEQVDRVWGDANTFTSLVGTHPDLTVETQPMKGWNQKIEVGSGFYSRATTVQGYAAAMTRFREAIMGAEAFNGEPIGLTHDVAEAWLDKYWEVVSSIQSAGEALERLIERVENVEDITVQRNFEVLLKKFSTLRVEIDENNRKPARLKVLFPIETYVAKYQALADETERFDVTPVAMTAVADDEIELDDSKGSAVPLQIMEPLPEVDPGVAMRLAKAEHVARMLSDATYRDRYDGDD